MLFSKRNNKEIANNAGYATRLIEEPMPSGLSKGLGSISTLAMRLNTKCAQI
jgi:hypothetical protein